MRFVLAVAALLALFCGVGEAQTYRDGDIERLRGSDPSTLAALSIEESTLEADGLSIPLTTLRNPALPADMLFFVMHDEEDEAFEAMAWAVAQFGGVGIAVENRDRREIDGIDLNTLFARADRPQLNAAFDDLIRSKRIVIALHNNYNYPAGSMHLTNTRYFTQTCDAGDDIDDVLITGQIGGGGGPFCERPEIAAYVSRGLNVAAANYQDRRGQPFDCTSGCNFQRFVISHFGVRYFNLETEHDTGSLQQKLQICAILDPERRNGVCTALR